MNVNNVVRTITIRGTSEGLDKVTGDVNKLAAAQQNVAVVSEQSARRVLSLEDAWKKQSLKLDEAARSQANISRETKIADGALREGLITQQQHAERLNLISQRYSVAGAATQKFTQQTGLARHELINLSRQAQDVGVSLASGQSPLMVLAQQGTQIADIFVASNASVRSFASQAVGWLGRFATSAAGAATGALAIGAGALYAASSWADAQREIDRALIGLGRRSGATANDINQIARAGATATGLSVDQARDAALEFVKTGAIYKDNIKSAVAVTHDFAIVTGKDAKDAAKDLGAALANPLQGADALNASLGFLDGRTREYIATLVSQNRQQEAQAVLLRNLAPAIQGATNTLGPFERAWNAVANAAIGAKNAIGAALTPRTDEQRRDDLVGAINRSPRVPTGAAAQGNFLEPGFNAREAGPQFDSPEVLRKKQAVESLNESLRETARARALAFSGDIKISSDADQAVRELLPYIDQLKVLEGQLNKIRAAQGGAKDRQGLGAMNDPAARAAQAATINTLEAAGQADRLNQITLQIASNYRDVGVETAKVLINMQGQIEVAGAITGAEKIRAQEVARTVQLYLEGKTIIEATAVAAAERQAAEAAATAAVEQQVFSLNQQTDLIVARLNGTESTVKAEQAYENALRSGADAASASAIQAATLANERAKDMERAAAAAEREASAAADAQRRWNAAAQALKFIPFYLLDAMLMMDKLFDSKQGGKSQFNPQGYKSTSNVMGDGPFGPGGQSQSSLESIGSGQSRSSVDAVWDSLMGAKPNVTAQGWEFFANAQLGKGLSINELGSKMLNTGNTGSGGFGGKAVIDDVLAQSLDRIRALLDPSEQKSLIQQELEQLAGQDDSLFKEERISQLNEQLKQLQDALNKNTDALKASLDPIFSQGHDYINSLKIGFYKAAGGFDGVVRGGTPGVDSVPINIMAQQGERVMVLPNGWQNARKVSNDNSRNVVQNITQNINIADVGPVNRLTARQMAQGFIGAAARAVS